jgi:hypothetical protein
VTLGLLDHGEAALARADACVELEVTLGLLDHGEAALAKG